MIEEGVFRIYLPTLIDEAMCEFLDQNADVVSVEDLPQGRIKRHIQQIFEEHIFIADPSRGLTVERVLTLGAKTPPSVVEISIASAVLYHATRTKCALAAQYSRDWADCYELTPNEVTNTLLSMDWTCAGQLGPDVFSAVKFIAKLSVSLGPKLILPRSTWIQPGPYFDQPYTGQPSCPPGPTFRPATYSMTSALAPVTWSLCPFGSPTAP